MIKKNKEEEHFLFKNIEITDKIIDYYRKNPKELDLIIDQEHFHIRFLMFFFLLGSGLTITARVLMYFFADVWGDFLNDIVLDIISELGIAIFGGAVTAYFLEYLQKKQYEQNKLIREQIKRRLESE